MSERPILFSAPMVRAILAGRKTQTRRVVRLPHQNPLGEWKPTTIGGYGVTDSRGHVVAERPAIWHTRTGDTIAAPWETGDTLWVRETCRAHERSDGLDGVVYEADGAFHEIENTIEAGERWSVLYGYRGKRGATVPPIHVPRWASRITLRVESVRVERVQDISDDDAYAEGAAEWADAQDLRHSDGTPAKYPSAHHAFRALWDSINAKRDYGWDANPWVWVVQFARI